MKIKFLGHAAFLITTADGVRIVTDPYEPGGFGGAIAHGPLEEPADIVIISHGHADHNYVKMVPGDPVVVQGPGEQTHRGITFRALASHHDTSRGAERGRNVVRVIDADGMAVCHLGDLGHDLSAEDATALGSVDVLLIPVGGTFTIDAQGATTVVNRLRPRIAVPMHYRTPKVSLNIAAVDGFLADKPRVRRVAGSEIEVAKETLPEPTEIVVLEPAL
ncbi:MAG: MBL fold metallo-hydrolase [Armatimonadota bacterium]|nr:MAG: MBL fold metallo-hydrolase [Armatimonadota bacterium]